MLVYLSYLRKWISINLPILIPFFFFFLFLVFNLLQIKRINMEEHNRATMPKHLDRLKNQVKAMSELTVELPNYKDPSKEHSWTFSQHGIQW